jgi:ABC-type multidrug transport system fused ATPase/permease subunit
MMERLSRLGYSTRGLVVIATLALVTGILEGAGVSLLLPLFALIQAKGAAESGTAQLDSLTSGILGALEKLHIDPSIDVLLLAVAGLVVFRQVVAYSQVVIRSRMTLQAELYNRLQIFGRLLEARLTAPMGADNGSLINALTRECRRAADYVIALIAGGTAVFKLIIYGGICLLISWQGTLITIVIIGLVSIGFARPIMQRSRQESKRLTESNEELAKYFAERLSLLRLIKLAHTEVAELSAFQRQAREVFRVGNRLLELSARMSAVIEPTVVLCVLALVYFWVMVLETPLANMGVLVVVMMRLLPLAQEAMANLQIARANSHSVVRLLEMRHSLAHDVEPIDQGGAFPSSLGEGVRLEGVNYSYPATSGEDGAPPLALTEISLLIPAGKTTALLGPSGAGKSTLFDLLPRLREPQQGRILFGDTDAMDISLSSLRSSIALVSQEVLLIDGSVADNLRYGNQEASDEAIREAAKAAYADGFIEELPLGYDTVLGPRGARLSGGQRQRIALARAFLAKVPILLLDEPTSALDAESEQAVQQALERQQKEHGTTIVIIAHRLSTVSHADLTVVLDHGKVIAIGTHQELMESAPWYQKIVALQR